MAVFRHQRWSSKAAFLLATAGASVGLGNLWRFPYLAGSEGGAAFVLIYVGFVFLIGVPIITAEIALGRMGGLAPIGTIARIAKAEGRSGFWRAIGYLSLAVPFFGFTYYSVVAGWSVAYTGKAFSGALAGLSAGASPAAFAAFAASPAASLLFQGLVIFLTALVVGRGLHDGIERAAKVLMPLLFLILLFLAGYNALTADFAGAFRFLFAPDFSSLSGASVMHALGQAFFSVGVGVGFMITYGAYLPKAASIPKAAAQIAALDTAVALLAGLAIFPIVLSSGLDPGEGPGLVFVTMPVAFAGIPLGQALGVLFFALLFVAAFTSTIAMLEPLVSTLEERIPAARLKLALATGAAIWAVGVFPALSAGPLSGVRPFALIGPLAGKGVFEAFDFFVASILIPVNAFLIALFAGWMVSARKFRAELGMSDATFRVWRALMRFVAPLAVAAITVYGLAG